MISFARTDSKNQDFVDLVSFLDKHLAESDGNDHAFYAQFNKIDTLRNVIVAYDKSEPVACGAFKKIDDGTVEIKRMFSLPMYRGKGVAARLLVELEEWAKELSFKRCILETGLKQPDAIKFYTKNNYNAIPNYGQYADVGNSKCFSKDL